MKVIFTGDPLELERNEGLSRMSTTLFGVKFPMSAEVDVSHLSEVQKRKLLKHSHFRVAGVDAETPRSLILPAGAKVEPLEAAKPLATDEGSDEAEATGAHVDRATSKHKK